MVVKTTKTPRKTTTKKATVKKPEHKTVDTPVTESAQPVVDNISKTDIVIQNTIKKVEEDTKSTIEIIEPIIEKEIKQAEQLSYTTVPYIIRLIKKLKFW